MVPDTLMNYFLASAGAGAALVGLVFVAISLSPKEAMRAGTASQWRTVAGHAFFCPHQRLFCVPERPQYGTQPWLASARTQSPWAEHESVAGTSVAQANEGKRVWPRIIANWVMLFVSLVLYGVQGYYGVRLLLAPHDVLAAQGVSIVLVLVYGLGLLRAWELTGIEQVGVRRWLNPLQSLAPRATPSEEGSERTSSSHEQE